MESYLHIPGGAAEVSEPGWRNARVARVVRVTASVAA